MHGTVESSSTVAVAADPTDTRVSMSLSAPWIWYRVDVLPSSSLTLRLRRVQLSQSEVVSGGMSGYSCNQGPSAPVVLVLFPPSVKGMKFLWIFLRIVVRIYFPSCSKPAATDNSSFPQYK